MLDCQKTHPNEVWCTGDLGKNKQTNKMKQVTHTNRLLTLLTCCYCTRTSFFFS